VGVSLGLIAVPVGTTGVAGTNGVVEHAASSNIRLQLKTTIRLNMGTSPLR
jgi:hypothetical protein